MAIMAIFLEGSKRVSPYVIIPEIKADEGYCQKRFFNNIA
jgi:hypothetical protein